VRTERALHRRSGSRRWTTLWQLGRRYVLGHAGAWGGLINRLTSGTLTDILLALEPTEC
jgi:hypothetical protein